MRLIHVQTVIQTVFGVVDEDGNLSVREPITGQTAVFSSETFAEAFAAINAKRAELEEAAE